jgi:hypothetical protein
MAVDADPSETPVSSAKCLCEDWFPTMHELPDSSWIVFVTN